MPLVGVFAVLAIMWTVSPVMAMANARMTIVVSVTKVGGHKAWIAHYGNAKAALLGRASRMPWTKRTVQWNVVMPVYVIAILEYVIVSMALQAKLVNGLHVKIIVVIVANV